MKISIDARRLGVAIASLSVAGPALADSQAFVSNGYTTIQDPFLVQTTTATAEVALMPQGRVFTSVAPTVGEVSASATLSYTVSVAPAAYAGMNLSGSGTLSTPLKVTYAGAATAPSLVPGYFGQDSSEITQLHSCFGNSDQSLSGSCGAYGATVQFTWNYAYYYNNTVYDKPLYVDLEAYASSSHVGVTASAFADPIFSLPTGSPLSLVLSGGVGNSAAPEPATWALLLTGFGLTGVVVRRRRDAAA
jgi:hypothetical protein